MRFEGQGKVREHLHPGAGSNIFRSMLLSLATGHPLSIYEALRALQLVARGSKPLLDPMAIYFSTTRSRMSSPS